MIKIKNNKKIFFRSLYLSLVIIFCLTAGLYGISKAYESIRQIGFGEYRRAIEITEEEIMLFDFKISLNRS